MVRQQLTTHNDLIVSHARHEGVPSFSKGEWGNVPYCTHVSVPDVSPAYSYRPHANGFKHGSWGILFFAFMEWHHRNRNYGRLSAIDCSWVITVLSIHRGPALQSRHDYDDNVHNSSIYFIKD